MAINGFTVLADQIANATAAGNAIAPSAEPGHSVDSLGTSIGVSSAVTTILGNIASEASAAPKVIASISGLSGTLGIVSAIQAMFSMSDSYQKNGTIKEQDLAAFTGGVLAAIGTGAVLNAPNLRKPYYNIIKINQITLDMGPKPRGHRSADHLWG